jgi:hypothetical protein
MRSLFILFAAGGLLLGGCGGDSKSSQRPGENPVTAPVDYLGTVGKGYKSATKTLATVSLDAAIKQFYEQENRYPKTLDELVSSRVLPKLPAAPNGMKFDYDPATGQVKVVPATPPAP